ncbi:polyprenyl synthetase family protein [Kitasatospora sp. NPDC006697]|uniref:polyprenyl synthetase family protein n=1 Tax=Kitasatospora sp. NPDC006697 TaxID=3364020 RepID=UPI0036C26BD4
MADGPPHAALKQRVDGALRAFVEQEVGLLLEIDAELAPVAEQLRAATRHGKRLRAAFCYWGWRAAGQADSEALVRACAAMELVHAAAVVHDDLIDRSRIRHGRPTAQWALREALPRLPRRAAAAEALAMLVGDLLTAWAGQLFTDCGLPAAYLSRARALWAALARELVAGECLEILHTGAPPDTATSLKVVRYKTAKYTVEQPLLIGAALGGASPGLRDCFTGYGLPLGEAFQLRDDLLGLFGDPARTGKANADDLTARRPTALLAETWRCATPAERAELRRLLGSAAQDTAALDRAREIMRRTRAPARIERMIDERVRTATEALDRASLPRQAAQALTDLARTATSRHH